MRLTKALRLMRSHLMLTESYPNGPDRDSEKEGGSRDHLTVSPFPVSLRS